MMLSLGAERRDGRADVKEFCMGKPHTTLISMLFGWL